MGIAGLAGAALCGVMASSALAQSMTMPPGGVVAPDALNAPPAVAMPPDAGQPPAQGGPSSSCDAEMMSFQKQRGDQLLAINNLVKSGKKGQMDPVAACPKFRGLVAIESKMKAWALKNKEWCSIPDQFIESMNVGFAKTPTYAQRACAAAEMVKRGGPGGPGGPMPAQPTVKLPSGPL